jgi:hypothetical protein
LPTSGDAGSIARPFFFSVLLGFELKAFTLSYSTSPFFVVGFFKIGAQELLAWAWLQTINLLIS